MLNVNHIFSVTFLPTRKNAKGQKLEKGNFCPFCHQLRRRLKTHLIDVHKTETAVARLMIASREESRRIMTELRNSGNFTHNLKVKKDGTGQINVSRAPAAQNSRSIKDSYPCHNCKAFYSFKSLAKHKCVRLDLGKPKLAISKALVNNSMLECSPAMGTIFAELYEDSIGNEVRNDPLIREYLRFKCQNGLAELEQKERKNIRGTLRYAAKMLSELKKKEQFKQMNYFDLLNPVYFDDFVNAALACGKAEDKTKLGWGALKMGNAIMNLAARQSVHGVARSELERMNAERFLSRYKSDWTELVSKKVRYDMKSTERTKKKMLLPTTEDFVKFSGFIRQKMIQACEEVKINASPKKQEICSSLRYA